ncbi:MmgE/PrpD family protein [Sphingomonas pokkalii]|uniref:MmgE/PrpD n=1 Tax=Sphingomonas pokkalii TaxID=2175090 RepID=A0A2U0SH59_9SPHN|nr:MmgE/PrpD family protein [Sphingomonas pokkalii]PVX30692.1 MmgE/PrpD [Sphingomonas pokkalii]
MSATAQLIAFARAEHRLPPPVRAAALGMLADTLAVGAAGARAPGADGVRAAAARWGAGDDCRILGRSEKLPATGAAFVNAFQIHCLEWDALHEPAVVHALSTVTAALLAAIGRRGGCDPEAALTALAVGVDVASGLGLIARTPLRFFRPATAGTVGAALAVARIEGIERFDDVLGLAVAQIAGTMQAHVEGSIALPLQVANAARAAIAAVDLVAAGLSGPHDALEGPFGYLKLFDEGELGNYTAQAGSVWRIAECSIKPWPSGRASHGLLAAIDTLLREGAIDAERIATIELFAPPLIARLVGRPPVVGMAPGYARLCLPLLTAQMLLDGRIDPRRFTSESLDHPAVLALAARVRITLDGNPDPNALGPQRVVVTLTDGTTIERAIPNTLGHPDAPMRPDQTRAKLALAAELAPQADPRIFTDPLGYFACPEP